MALHGVHDGKDCRTNPDDGQQERKGYMKSPQRNTEIENYGYDFCEHPELLWLFT
jgi:hypothetical protein